MVLLILLCGMGDIAFRITPRLRDAVARALSVSDKDTSIALQRFSRADATEITLDDVQLMSDRLRQLNAAPPVSGDLRL